MYSQSEVSRGQDGIIWLKRRKSVYDSERHIWMLAIYYGSRYKTGLHNLKILARKRK